MSYFGFLRTKQSFLFRIEIYHPISGSPESVQTLSARLGNQFRVPPKNASIDCHHRKVKNDLNRLCLSYALHCFPFELHAERIDKRYGSLLARKGQLRKNLFPKDLVTISMIKGDRTVSKLSTQFFELCHAPAFLFNEMILGKRRIQAESDSR